MKYPGVFKGIGCCDLFYIRHVLPRLVYLKMWRWNVIMLRVVLCKLGFLKSKKLQEPGGFPSPVDALSPSTATGSRYGSHRNITGEGDRAHGTSN